jgi:hypothetical protein
MKALLAIIYAWFVWRLLDLMLATASDPRRVVWWMSRAWPPWDRDWIRGDFDKLTEDFAYDPVGLKAEQEAYMRSLYGLFLTDPPRAWLAPSHGQVQTTCSVLLLSVGCMFLGLVTVGQMLGYGVAHFILAIGVGVLGRSYAVGMFQDTKKMYRLGLGLSMGGCLLVLNTFSIWPGDVPWIDHAIEAGVAIAASGLLIALMGSVRESRGQRIELAGLRIVRAGAVLVAAGDGAFSVMYAAAGLVAVSLAVGTCAIAAGCVAHFLRQPPQRLDDPDDGLDADMGLRPAA